MNETKGNIESILQEVGKKIDLLVHELKEAGTEAKEEIKVQVQKLKKEKEKLQKEFDQIKNRDKWKEAKSHFTSAAEELRKGVERIFKKN